VTEKRTTKKAPTRGVRAGAAKTKAKASERTPKGPTENASDGARKLALAIATAGFEKKASGVEILDVAVKVDYADVLVLMSGRSDRHVSSIARGIIDELKKASGTVPLSVEGLTAGQWILIDFNDVVVHVFQQATRYYYDLEGLWIDAARLKVPEPANRGDGEGLTSGDA
jgi:ribosome-associated protein